MTREEIEAQVKDHLEQIYVLCKVYDPNFKSLNMHVSADELGAHIDAFNTWTLNEKQIKFHYLNGEKIR